MTMMTNERPPSDDLDRDTEPSSMGSTAGIEITGPVLTVLSHRHVERVGDRAYLSELLRLDAQVELSRLAPDFAPPGTTQSQALADPRVSRKPVWIRREDSDAFSIDASDTSTKIRVDGEEVAGRMRITRAHLERGVVIELAGRVALLFHLAPPVPRDRDHLGLIGYSHAIVRLREQIRSVAASNVNVLLRGETGSGKELVACAIHDLSKRSSGPHVAINMATIPSSIAASELFGHERGAFTGATASRIGYFARAHKGTLFLDEVGDTNLAVQAALLRSVETQTILPIGAGAPRNIDVRVIAATDADLDSAVDDGTFRRALLHRLSGFVIEVPPLRARREDIGMLLVHFLRQELAAMGKAGRLDNPDAERAWLGADLVGRLARYAFPGNVRELRNAARQIAIASHSHRRAKLGSYLEGVLSSAPLRSVPPADRRSEMSPNRAHTQGARPSRKPSTISEEELVEALSANQWRIAHTAAQLGVARASLYGLIERSERIQKASDLDAAAIEACRSETDGTLEDLACALCVSPRGLRLRMRELGLD